MWEEMWDIHDNESSVKKGWPWMMVCGHQWVHCECECDKNEVEGSHDY